MHKKRVVMTALVHYFVPTLPSHFKMQNINHTMRTDFLSPARERVFSPVSCLSYTGTGNSCAVLQVYDAH